MMQLAMVMSKKTFQFEVDEEDLKEFENFVSCGMLKLHQWYGDNLHQRGQPYFESVKHRIKAVEKVRQAIFEDN